MNKMVQNMILKKFAPELAKKYDVDINGFHLSLTDKATGRVMKYQIQLVPVLD